jgi:Protein of unknown function with PCYCGC motif
MSLSERQLTPHWQRPNGEQFGAVLVPRLVNTAMKSNGRKFVTNVPYSRRWLLGISLSTAGIALTGCSIGEKTPDGESDLVAWPSENRWPEQFRESPSEVQEAYRFVATNPDVLQYIPCFCGCVDLGHTCIRDCYVAEFRGDGSVLLDPMSFG